MSEPQVTALSITAVKATRLQTVQEIMLERTGARGDRRFFLIDERGRMVNGKRLGRLQAVQSSYDEASERLSLELPDGTVIADTIRFGHPVQTEAYGNFRIGRLVDGPWGQALSDWLGEPLRLIETDSAVDRGTDGATSLVSRGSLRRLAQEAGAETLDARRFRMLIEIDGVEPHAEDRWVGRSIKVGEAVIRFEGHVGRCIITSRDPDTGMVDLPTLDLLRSYRGAEASTEPLPFGVHGRVVLPGTIAVGDPVAPI